jgi:hypothetical protein
MANRPAFSINPEAFCVKDVQDVPEEGDDGIVLAACCEAE